MKKELKVYLEDSDYKKLLLKAEAVGFSGRGAISHYISKIARESIAFIPSDVEVVLKLKV